MRARRRSTWSGAVSDGRVDRRVRIDGPEVSRRPVRLTAPVRLGLIGPVHAAVARVTAVAVRVPAVAVALGCDESAQLAGSIEPDEDLPEEPLVTGRLAAGLDRLDGHVGDRPRHVGGREWAAVKSFRWRQQTRARDEVGIAGAAVDRQEPDVGAGPRSRLAHGSWWNEIDDAGDLLVAILEAGTDQPEPGLDTT